MHSIYLLRHADAAPRDEYEDDHARDLSPAGQRQARRLGRFVDETGHVPDQFVSSTAVRARRTAELLAGQWTKEVPFRATHALYQAAPADVVNELQTMAASLESVLVVGHEPAWSAAVSGLIGSANVSLPPGTCVKIDTEARWADLQFGDGILRWMVPPTLLQTP